MHVPDGFLNAPTSVATAVVAAGVVAIALARSRRELGGAGSARAGLVACFVFAAQMVNFPVGAGTSGHLIGATLAAVLIGPWTATLVMTSVVLVQGLFFADGGLTALGTNVLLLAGVAVAGGWLVSRAVLVAMPRRRTLPWAAGLGGFVSVPLAALAFTGLYAVGGAVPVPLPLLTGAMVGVHAVLGVGEGLITAGIVAAVAATQPQLVHALPAERRTLQLIDADGSVRVVAAESDQDTESSPDAGPPGRATRSTALVALTVTAMVAGGLSLLASTRPDGLERVAGSLGFDVAGLESAFAGSPLAEYSIPGLGPIGTSLAGLAGAAVTLIVMLGLVTVLDRSRRAAAHQAE
jgi:cobalt/nickel transport system permease protein